MVTGITKVGFVDQAAAQQAECDSDFSLEDAPAKPRISFVKRVVETGKHDPVVERARTLEEATQREISLRNNSRGIWKTLAKFRDRRIPLVLAIMIGVIIIGVSIPTMDSRQGATGAKCKILSHYYPGSYNFLQGADMPCPENLGFTVRGFTTNGGSSKRVQFQVDDWEPAYDPSRTTQFRGWGLFEAFRCCPLDPFDHCKFFKDGRFCDDWGAFSSGCPSAPWDCYIVNHGDVLQNALDGGIKAKSLKVGSISDGKSTFSLGIVLVVLGTAALLAPKTVTWVWRNIVLGFLVRLVKLFAWDSALLIGQVVPRRFLPEWVVDIMKKDMAIQMIQRWWKCIYFQTCLKRLLLKARAEGQRSEQMLKGEKFLRKAEKTLRFAAYAPPLTAPVPLSNCLIYDSGHASTFHRMAKGRIVSAPGEARVGIELVLGPQIKLGAKLVLRRGSGFKAPPYVERIFRRGLADLYGLQERDELVKAGELVWPTASAEQLLKAVGSAPRPLFLVFVGSERRPETLQRNGISRPPWASPHGEVEKLKHAAAQAAADRLRGTRTATRAAALAANPPQPMQVWRSSHTVEVPGIPLSEPAMLDIEAGFAVGTTPCEHFQEAGATGAPEVCITGSAPRHPSCAPKDAEAAFEAASGGCGEALEGACSAGAPDIFVMGSVPRRSRRPRSAPQDAEAAPGASMASPVVEAAWATGFEGAFDSCGEANSRPSSRGAISTTASSRPGSRGAISTTDSSRPGSRGAIFATQERGIGPPPSASAFRDDPWLGMPPETGTPQPRWSIPGAPGTPDHQRRQQR